MFNMLSFSVYPNTFLCEMYLFKENIEFCRRYFYIYLEFVPKSNQCHSRWNYTYFVNFRVMNCLGNWSQEQRLGNNKEESILRLLIWEYKVLSTNRLFLSKKHMMTSSNGNIFRVTGHLCGEFTGPRWIPAQRPVTRSFDVFFDLRLNKRLSKQS